MTFEEFGWMAAAVNFSDIASMGARPAGILAALSMPPDLDESCVYDMMTGMDRCAEHCGTHIVGGDTKTGAGSICGTAVGDMEDREPMTRSGARPGDIVAVTGTLGSPAAGHYALKNGVNEPDAVRSLKLPMPRVREGIILAESGVTSCMDISDGLSSAVSEICGKSDVGMEIRWGSLPTGAGVLRMTEFVREETMMLDFGGEYELLFTVPENRTDELHRKMDFTVIGTVTDGEGAYLLKQNGRTEIRNGGYEHFKDRS
jgi:thiamine-monophosphate kinase